jgi:abortive infection bacteriophage resistance protein
MRKRGESCMAKVFFRNICAHGERLYSYKTKNAIPDFPIHDKLGIIKKGKQYECGKHDLFAVVIALRYLLPKDLFKKFKQELANLLSKHLSATSCYTEKEFLKYMGFPENWIKITRYRKL